MKHRRGFTLLETAIVLAITAIGALLVLPNWPAAFSADETRDITPGAALAQTLSTARQQAIVGSQRVFVRVDAARGQLRMDTVGVNGRGVWREAPLPLAVNELLVTADTAALIVFYASGAAQGRPMMLRHDSGWITITVDPWSGEVTHVAR